MAERTNDTPGDAKSRSRSLGRRIAAAIVGCGLLYLVGVGLVSVIPQVFWPETAELDPSITCAAGLRDLQDELLAFAGEHVARGGTEGSAGVRAYFSRWDLRHRALEARCEADERDAWVRLGRMRERLQGTLERFDAEEGALARHVDNTLSRRER